jgi:iron complex outermembrane receptor protein
MTQNNNFTQARCAGVNSIGKPDWIGRFGRKLQRYSGFHSARSDSSTALKRTAFGFTALTWTPSGETPKAIPVRCSISGAHSVSRGTRPASRSALIGRSVAAFFAALVLCMGSASYAADDSSMHFEIKAKPLADALMEFGVQSGLTVVAPSTLTAGKKAASIRGELTPTVALGRLLKGSGLTFARAANGTIAIQAISVSGPTQASAGESGLDEDLTSSDKALEEIIVTGTHIRGVTNNISPVMVYDRADIERSGYSTTQQFIQSLPQNFGGGDSETTLGGILGGENSNLNYGNASGANLRGLGNRATLTLLNGRRLAPVGVGDAVDLSVIPLAAIERIDVLTDGASAIYGSDAVGGVINIVLREKYDGAETRVRYGDVTEGANAEIRAGQTIGTEWGTGSALISYEYDKRDPLSTQDRFFTKDPLFLTGIDLIPYNRQQSALLSGSQELGSGAELYGNAVLSRRSSYYSYFSVGNQLTPITVGQYTANLGSRVNLGADWQLDAGGSYSYNRTQYTVFTDSEFQGNIDTRMSVQSAEVKADGSLFSLPAGKTKVAVGAQYRTETFDSRGTYSNTGGGDTRHVSTAYGELFIPVVGAANRMPGMEALEVSLAGRYEHYSDFGSTTNPKYGFMWAPIGGVHLRATYGTSFRAPTLYELSEKAEPLSPNVYQIPDPIPADPNHITNAIVLYGNNSQLRPERSTNWTTGFDFQPTFLPTFKASLTYFNIVFKDRIAEPLNRGLFDSLILESQHPTLIDRNPSLATVDGYFAYPNFHNSTPPVTPGDIGAIIDNQKANVSSTRESGLDLNSTYGLVTVAGTFTFQAGGTYLLEKKDRLTSNSPFVSNLNSVFNPADLKLRNSLMWNRGGLGAAVFMNYVGHYRDIRPGFEAPVGSYTTFDLNLRYNTQGKGGVFRHMTFALAALNVLDRAPPHINYYGFDFDATNASAVGRYLSLDVTKQWGKL